MSKKHSKKFTDLVDDALTRVPEITADELVRKIRSKNDFMLIDTRELSEFEEGIIPGAVHLSKGVIERDIEKYVSDTEKELILYCGGGYRSALAGDNLKKMGYANVWSLAGGWKEWTAKGHETE